MTIEVLGIFYEKSLMLPCLLFNIAWNNFHQENAIWYMWFISPNCTRHFVWTPVCKNENKSFRRILKCSQGENCVRISDQRFYCTLFFPCLQRSKACCLTIKSFCLLYMFTSSAKQAQVSPSSNSHIFATIFEGKENRCSNTCFSTRFRNPTLIDLMPKN